MPIFVAAPLLLLLFTASAVPWLLVFRQRYGHRLAVTATATGSLLLLLAVLVVSHLIRVNYMTALVVSSILAGALGLLVARRTPNVVRRPSRYAVALWVPALLGGLVWVVTVAAAQFVPGMSRFGWAMNGDALNNLSFADVIVSDNGIPLDQSTYSVPLSTALIATGIGAGSPPSQTARGVLEHHLEAFTLVWVIMLVVLCVAIGVVCAMFVSPGSTRLVAIVSALGSLLPLTWFFSGLIIQWGYFNIDVVLPVVLGAWIVYLDSKRHPLFALGCLVALGVLAFASWTPMAALIGALGIALLIRERTVFFNHKVFVVVLLAVVAGAVVLLSLFVNLGSVFTLNGELSATGAGFTGFVNLWWVVPIVTVAVVGALLLARRRTALPVASGFVGLLVAGVATGALLVYLASGDGELFGAYYPKKFAWLALAIMAVLLLSFLIGAFAGRVRPALISAIMVIALLAATAVPPGTWPETVQRQPVVRIAGDFVRHDGEATVNEILRLTTTEHSTMLWQSGDPDEPIVNEWLLLAKGGLANGNPKILPLVATAYFLYRASGHYSDYGVNAPCRILSALPGKRVIITANPDLGEELHSACPRVDVTVVVDSSRRGPIPSRTGENWLSDGIEGPLP